MERDSYDSDGEEIADQDKVLGKDTVEVVEGSYREKVGIWSRITMWKCLTNSKLFRELENPKKMYSIDDAQGLRPFVTKWVRAMVHLKV